MAVDINGNEIKIGDRVKRVVDVKVIDDWKRYGSIGEVYTVSSFDVLGGLILEELVGGYGASSNKFEIVTDNKKTIEEKLEIIRAYLEGAEIEYSSNGNNHWVKTNTPVWNWETNDYRVKPVEIKEDYIDWSHVSDEFNFMARDESGDSYLYRDKPNIVGRVWTNQKGFVDANLFVSLKKGNKPWNESLVKRP